ncbi:MAG: hypothetical protein WCY11_10580, partial [Novosphingobium sp.]
SLMFDTGGRVSVLLVSIPEPWRDMLPCTLGPFVILPQEPRVRVSPKRTERKVSSRSAMDFTFHLWLSCNKQSA